MPHKLSDQTNPSLLAGKDKFGDHRPPGRPTPLHEEANKVLRMAATPFKRPIELVAFKGRLERALNQEKALAETGKQFDAVMDSIDTKHGQITEYLGWKKDYDGQLSDVIKRMIGDGSNNPPSSTESDGRTGGTETDSVK